MSKKQKVTGSSPATMADVSWDTLKSKHLIGVKQAAKENFESSKLQVEQQLQQAPVDCNSKLEECLAANKLVSLKPLEASIAVVSRASEVHDKLESDMDGLLSQLQRVDNSSSFLMRTIKDEEKRLSSELDSKDKVAKANK